MSPAHEGRESVCRECGDAEHEDDCMEFMGFSEATGTHRCGCPAFAPERRSGERRVRYDWRKAVNRSRKEKTLRLPGTDRRQGKERA
jgi:hypothetical protein